MNMQIDLDSLQELSTLGLLAERPAAAALLAELQSAGAERTALIAARAAEHDAAVRARTPIVVVLPSTPEAADDTAIIQIDRRPILSCVTIDGQLFEPRLGRGPISFLPVRCTTALVRTNAPGWSWCSVAQVSALNELFGAQDFRAVISASTSEQIPVLIANYRRLSGRSGAIAKSQASLLANKLSQLSHSTSGLVQGSARAEHDAEERAADQILALAGPLAAQHLADEDPIDRQLRAANEQENRRLDTMSARADRDATRSLFNEAAENAKFEAAVKAAEVAAQS